MIDTLFPAAPGLGDDEALNALDLTLRYLQSNRNQVRGAIREAYPRPDIDDREPFAFRWD